MEVEIDSRSKKIIYSILKLNQEQRGLLFNNLWEKICSECYGEHPVAGKCHCWNDE